MSFALKDESKDPMLVWDEGASLGMCKDLDHKQFEIDVNVLIQDTFPAGLQGDRSIIRFVQTPNATWVCATDLIALYGYSTDSATKLWQGVVSPENIQSMRLKSSLRHSIGYSQYVLNADGFKQLMEHLDAKIHRGKKSMERRLNVEQMKCVRNKVIQQQILN